MKYILTVLIITLLAIQADGQFKGYPQLPHHAQSLDNFVPDRWELIDNDRGDLNKDGAEDIVFVLQSRDSIPAEDEDWHWSIPDYPRILGIAFWDSETNGYKLEVQSNEFVITQEGNGAMEEPFQGVGIGSNGTLHFRFGSWYSMGTWYTGTSTYIFRYQNNRFELIGQELTSFHRASHEATNVSINYSTRKAIYFSQESEEDKGITKTVSFEIDKLPTFRTIGAAGFEPAVKINGE